MSSINSPDIIQTILSNNGVFPGDSRLYSVWSYTNDWNGLTFKLCYRPLQEDAFLSSPFVHSPKLLWSAASGLTPAATSLFPELAQ